MPGLWLPVFILLLLGRGIPSLAQDFEPGRGAPALGESNIDAAFAAAPLDNIRSWITMSTPQAYRELHVWVRTVCITAWLMAAACGSIVVLRLARRATRGELTTILMISTFAFALRIALPWGPLNFVDADRLGPLWRRTDPWAIEGTMATVPVALVMFRSVGLSPLLIMRLWGPLVGALSVAVTYLGGRAFRLAHWPAAVAALAVACWPAHVHFSTWTAFSVEAGLLGTAALAVAAAANLGALTIPLLVALVTLTVFVRPEFRLIVIPVAVLLTTPTWSWQRRGLVAAGLALALWTYVPFAIAPPPDTGGAQGFRRSLLAQPIIYAVPWICMAAAGLVVGKAPWRVRGALAAGLAGLGFVYLYMASDLNLVWLQWRYLTSMVPWFALGGSFLLAHVIDSRFRRVAVAGAVGLAVLPLVVGWRTLTQVYNEQAAFQFVRATAGDWVAGKLGVYVLSTEETGVPEDGAVLGLVARFGPIDTFLPCESESRSPELVVTPINRVLARCPEKISTEGYVLFLGVHRTDATLAPVRARFEIVPLMEQNVPVIVGTVPDTFSILPDTKPIDAKFGWYRLLPRSERHPDG